MLARQLADNFSISPQIEVDDVAAIAAAGFTQVICNRPDDEEPGQTPAIAIANACAAQNIQFHHLPFQGLSPQLIERFRELMNDSAGPTLAYCRSGQRCAFLWQNALNAPS